MSELQLGLSFPDELPLEKGSVRPPRVYWSSAGPMSIGQMRLASLHCIARRSNAATN